MKIPFVDLKANYLSIKDEIDTAISSVISSSAFVKGKELEQFEKNWAEMCGAGFCVGTSNGTASLELILRSLGVGAGDEVICPSHTFIATAEAIVNCGAKPVFADCHESSALIDANEVRKALTERTKAVIIVDLYGQPADHDAVVEAVGNKNITVIQDAAQSHLAEYKKKTVGSYAKVTSFSFYPGKNLGAYGDAGAAVTNDEELYKKIKMLSDHGRITKYEHLIAGTNARMDNLQASVLNVKMKHLADWNDKRRKIVRKYKNALEDRVLFIDEETYAKPVYHLCVIRTPYRKDLIKFLEEHEVSTGIHYPIPLHLQPAFKELGYNSGDLPRSEKISEEILSIPVFPEMTDEQTDFVIAQIKEYFR
ncbi:MAG: DegT/DnrJ/EryC1/StrS family aminotransferase [Candidatus Delongbacteria bacterium]|nr:DegT/DnrJ/EryC1/StrS family aminotransferase [Candidatus Delongbacteria bacterium]